MLDRSEYFEKPDALLTAALVGDFEACRLLLERGADPNQQDELGRTPLMIAIQEGLGVSFLADLLVQFGANINLLDQEGDSALDLAIFYKHDEAVQLLRVRGATSKSGPSAKQIRDDEIYQAFEDIDAVKRFISMIDGNKKP